VRKTRGKTAVPGVYVEEIHSGSHTIAGVATSITAFIGRAVRGPENEPTPAISWADFERTFGGLDPKYPMGYSVRDFFANGGTHALIVGLSTTQATVSGGPLCASDYLGDAGTKTGIHALDKVDLFNLLCIPPDTRAGDTNAMVYSAAMSYCYARRAIVFMQGLWRQGAFQGATPRDAYWVKCDRETTTQDDINCGVFNIIIGFAPLKPAEYVIIKLQQRAGQIQA
jgi:phage tail sheath protein FI